MLTSSHGAQLGRFWVIEKQILLAAGSTGYNSVADVVVGLSLGFPLCEMIVSFKSSSPWKEQPQQVPVEGWKGSSLGQELLPPFLRGIFFPPCWMGLDFLELVLVPAAQLGVLLVVVGDLHLQPNPVIAVAWVGSSPPAFFGKFSCCQQAKNAMELIPQWSGHCPQSCWAGMLFSATKQILAPQNRTVFGADFLKMVFPALVPPESSSLLTLQGCWAVPSAVTARDHTRFGTGDGKCTRGGNVGFMALL